MKIKKKFKDTSEPNPCVACCEEFNGINFIILEISKDFCVNLNLCDNCLNKLEGSLKV